MKLLQEFNETINKLVRTATFPVAVRVAQPGEEPPAKGKYPEKDLGHCLAICQGVSLARRFGWTILFRQEDHGCPASPYIFGYKPVDKLLEGRLAYPLYVNSLELGQQMEQALAKMPEQSVSELWISPLEHCSFEPDVILIYGNPAQIARLIQAANYFKGIGIESRGFGRGACTSTIVKPILNDDCLYTVPGGGERLFGLTADDEMVFSIPRSKIENVKKGLEITHENGIARMPTAFMGINTKPTFPKVYYDILK